MNIEINQRFKTLIPPLQDEEFNILEQSCLNEGIRDAVVLWNNTIIDGHNRYEIAQRHGLEFSTVEKDFDSEEDVICWMVDNQLGRRNLIDFVRLELAEKKKAALIEKGRAKIAENNSVRNGNLTLSIVDKVNHNTQKSIANDLGWSTGKVAMAEKVAKEADEETKERLRAGEVTINKVYQEIKKAEKIERQKEIYEQRQETVQSFDEEQVFELIYMDPPWRYDFSKSTSREIENHYTTMSIDELKEMDIPAADNCVLFMWATAPKLPQALELIESWGFEYKTNAVWDKEKIGMGYWFRGQHELILVATKGNVSPPEPTNRTPSVIREARGKHSKKPEIFYEVLENGFPYLSKVEIFSRNKREGWGHYGNEQI